MSGATSRDADIPLEDNECYSTNIVPVKVNECYGAYSLYTEIKEPNQLLSSQEYDYI